MGKILITGATGNVGMEVIKALTNLNHDYLVYSGVRNVQADDQNLESFNAQHIHFDFTNSDTFQPALTGIDILFLLRPHKFQKCRNTLNLLLKPQLKRV